MVDSRTPRLHEPMPGEIKYRQPDGSLSDRPPASGDWPGSPQRGEDGVRLPPASLYRPEHVARLAYDRDRAAEALRVTALEYAMRFSQPMAARAIEDAEMFLAFLQGEQEITGSARVDLIQPAPPSPAFSSPFHAAACAALGVPNEDDLGGVWHVVFDGRDWDVAYAAEFDPPANDKAWSSLVARLSRGSDTIDTGRVYGCRRPAQDPS